MKAEDDTSRTLRRAERIYLGHKKSIIDKRDDLIQHWQGNAASKFFTSVFAWDLPYLVYHTADCTKNIDDKKVNSVLAQVKTKIRASLDEQADSLQKIAWMEAWQFKVNLADPNSNFVSNG